MTTEGQLVLPSSLRGKVMRPRAADDARKEGRLSAVAANTIGLRGWRRGLQPDGSYTFPTYSTTRHGTRVALLEVTEREAFQRIFPGEEFVADRGDLVRGNRSYGMRPSVQQVLEELSSLPIDEVVRRFNPRSGTGDVALMRIIERQNRSELEALMSGDPNTMDKTIREAREFLMEELHLDAHQIARLVHASRRRRGVQTLFGPEVIPFIQDHLLTPNPSDDRTAEVSGGIPDRYIAAVVPLGRDVQRAFGI